jgi:hypothetical protein
MIAISSFSAGQLIEGQNFVYARDLRKAWRRCLTLHLICSLSQSFSFSWMYPSSSRPFTSRRRPGPPLFASSMLICTHNNTGGPFSGSWFQHHNPAPSTACKQAPCPLINARPPLPAFPRCPHRTASESRPSTSRRLHNPLLFGVPSKSLFFHHTHLDSGGGIS